VPLDTPSLTIAGSNVFRPRFWRPLVLPTCTSIKIRTLDYMGKRHVAAFVDGQPLGKVDSLHVVRSNIASVELMFSRQSDLSAKLLTSLLPVEDEDH
jgi:NAD kinase